MNLRGEEDKLGFPACDPIPSKILTEFPPTVGGYRTVCYAFFTALFDTLQEHLSTDHAARNAKTSVTNWATSVIGPRPYPDLAFLATKKKVPKVINWLKEPLRHD